MILILGGAYQGKLDFAKEKFNISDKDVFTCSEGEDLDFSKKVIYHTENFFLKCIKEGLEPKEVLSGNIEKLRDKIIIADDISQGIVPTDRLHRAWREATGKAMMYLAGEAEEVYRIFCGLSHRLK